MRTWWEMPFALQMTWIMGAVVDGVVFPDDPEVLLSRGQVLPVPYLLGVNSREFRWLLPFVSIRGCSLQSGGVMSIRAMCLGVVLTAPPGSLLSSLARTDTEGERR